MGYSRGTLKLTVEVNGEDITCLTAVLEDVLKELKKGRISGRGGDNVDNYVFQITDED